MNVQTVVFVGPQGSGKGTQVRNLIAYIKAHDTLQQPIFELETGDVFRKFEKKEGYTAELVKELLAHGEMMPFFFTIATVAQMCVDNLTKDSHFLLDGFPRNVEQAQMFDAMLAFYKRPKLSVIALNTPDEVVKERMMKRGRVDDVPELIDRRLALYKERTAPLLEHYKHDPIATLIEVDGTRSINAVFKQIVAGLGI